jgi:hypothetical protein
MCGCLDSSGRPHIIQIAIPNIMHAQLLAVIFLLGMAAPHLAAQPVAAVGASSINRQQLRHRIAIEKAYGGELTPEAALVSLINDALEHEISRGLELLPDSLELLQFSHRADQTSKAPQILAAVKNIFGRDSSEYRWLYLSPRLVNMKLHQYFIRDTILHATARHSIEQAYSLAAQGISFSDAAERMRIRYLVDSVRDRRASLPPELAQYAGNDSSVRDPYVQLVSGMKPGQLFNTIIETDGDYRVLRLMNRDDSVQVVELIAAGKGDFDEWFRLQAAKIEVRISNRGLRQEVIHKYPQLWWVTAMRQP